MHVWPMNIVVRNDIKELRLWNYEICLNNYICKKMKLYKPNIFINILGGDHWRISRVTDKHYGKNDINELYIWNYKTGLNN